MTTLKTLVKVYFESKKIAIYYTLNYKLNLLINLTQNLKASFPPVNNKSFKFVTNFKIELIREFKLNVNL